MPTGQNRQKPTLHGEAVTPGQGRKHYIWGTEQQLKPLSWITQPQKKGKKHTQKTHTHTHTHKPTPQHCNYGDPTPGEQNRNIATMDDPTPGQQNHNIATMDYPTPGKPNHNTATMDYPTPREQNCNTTRGGGMMSHELRRTNCCGLFLFLLPFTKCHHQTPTGYPIRKASPHSQCPPGQQVSYACSTQHSRAQVLQHQKSKAQLLISQML